MVNDMPNRALRKWLILLSLSGYLNNRTCLIKTLTVKVMATALIDSSIKTYGSKVIIIFFALYLSADTHQPLGIF